MASNTTFVSGAVLTAAQMNNLPWGVVTTTAGGTGTSGYVTRTAGNFTVSSTTADITGMTCTFTAAANTFYKISWIAYGQKDATAGWISVNVSDGANTVQQAVASNAVASGYVNCSGMAIVKPGAGSVTYKLRAACQSAGGTIYATTGGDACQMVIEMIGST
jgi:hypothetical protein